MLLIKESLLAYRVCCLQETCLGDGLESTPHLLQRCQRPPFTPQSPKLIWVEETLPVSRLTGTGQGLRDRVRRGGQEEMSIRPPRLRITFVMALLPLFLFVAHSATAQSPVGQASPSLDGAGFPPLDRWKAAVLKGDRAAIKAFYVDDPKSFAQTPQGKIADAAAEESDFWSRLAPVGLSDSCLP